MEFGWVVRWWPATVVVTGTVATSNMRSSSSSVARSGSRAAGGFCERAHGTAYAFDGARRQTARVSAAPRRRATNTRIYGSGGDDGTPRTPSARPDCGTRVPPPQDTHIRCDNKIHPRATTFTPSTCPLEAAPLKDFGPRDDVRASPA